MAEDELRRLSHRHHRLYHHDSAVPSSSSSTPSRPFPGFVARLVAAEPPPTPRQSCDRDLISLDHPRPDSARVVNDYVDVSKKHKAKFSSRPTTCSAAAAAAADHHVITVPLHAHDEDFVSSSSSPSFAPFFTRSCRRSTTAAPIGPHGTGATSDQSVFHSAILVQIQKPSSRVHHSAVTIPVRKHFVCSPPPGTSLKKASSEHVLVSCRLSAVGSSSMAAKSTGCISSATPKLPSSTTVITSQPRKSSSTSRSKITPVTFAGAGSQAIDVPVSVLRANSSSVICKECGKCRCAACTAPRSLPSCWLCRNWCLCSAGAVVDALSCMCCVRGCLYHVTPESIDLEDVCSCSSDNQCCARWSCLGVAALLLPCIWCYLPLRACAHLCDLAYAKYHDNGCRCGQRHHRSLLRPRRSSRTFVHVQQRRSLSEDRTGNATSRVKAAAYH